jgi:hypothetical protein
LEVESLSRGLEEEDVDRTGQPFPNNFIIFLSSSTNNALRTGNASRDLHQIFRHIAETQIIGTAVAAVDAVKDDMPVRVDMTWHHM